MSVVKPVRNRVGPEDGVLRLSQELPSQAMGPWTRWATSVMGWREILAPSKAQPPAAAPGVNALPQPFLRSLPSLPWFLAQAGSSITLATLSFNALIATIPTNGFTCRVLLQF